MALRIIVSYDDTDNDRDALALGRLLAFRGGRALTRLCPALDPGGGRAEALEQRQAEELLEHGAAEIGAPEMPRHVVVNASTSEGLTELAEREDADIIVFGSDYRTAAGPLKPGISAHKLLLGGPAAIAVAPAGLRSQASVRVDTVGVIDEGDETAARPPTASPRRSARRSASSTAAASTCSSSARGPRPPQGQVVPQRRQRLRRRGRDLSGDGGPARYRDQLRGGSGRACLCLIRTTAATVRVAAVEPSLRGADHSTWRASRPAVISARAASAPVERLDLDHDRRRRRPLTLAPPRRRRGRRSVTFSAPALGVRPALAEGELRRVEARALEDRQLATSADPSRGRRASIGRSSTQGSRTVSRSSSGPRLKARAWFDPAADLDVEGHRTTLCCADRWRPPPPAAVVFDNDGLLLDTESVWTRAEQDLFERRGLEFTPADKLELVGTSAEIAGGILERRLGEDGPRGGADRGAQRARRRRARARGRVDGRRP